MFRGKSPYHVNQNEGQSYSLDDVAGYYNNLTEKITKFGMPGEEIPVTADDDGTVRHFSIAIFQYGLAAYDLYLQTGNKSMLNRMKNCVSWAMENQLENGAWLAFEPQNPNEPFSAMAQGEGISLLMRYYKETNEIIYLNAAKKAIEFLLTNRKNGGVSEWNDNGLILYEYTYLPVVLNGWIFAAWGLLDYYKLTGDENIKSAWLKTIDSIVQMLPEFDCGYWSNYDNSKKITSLFYHKLHISQLNVLYQLTNIEAFRYYAIKWRKYENNRIYSTLAFITKVIQKLKE